MTKNARCGRQCRRKGGHPPLELPHLMAGMKPFRCRPTRSCEENCYTGHCSHCGYQKNCPACRRKKTA